MFGKLARLQSLITAVSVLDLDIFHTLILLRLYHVRGNIGGNLYWQFAKKLMSQSILVDFILAVRHRSLITDICLTKVVMEEFVIDS